MFKLLTAFAAAAILAVSSAFVASAETAYREVEVEVPPRMLFLGDSIATGYNLEGYDSTKENCRSYANILKEKYSAELPEDCSFERKNLAIDGQTSEELLGALNSGSLDNDVEQTDCVVISIGGNDLLGALWDTLKEAGLGVDSELSPSTILKLISSLGGLKDQLDENLALFETNLVSIAKYVNSRTNAEIIVQTLYDPLESFKIVPGISSIAEEKIGRLNDIIKLHAGDPSGTYTVCDVAPDFKGKANELTNIPKMDIHPNAEGHVLIADLLDKAVRGAVYHYSQAYEVEPVVSAVSENVGNGEETEDGIGTSTVIAIICAVCACAAVAAVIVIGKKHAK